MFIPFSYHMNVPILYSHQTGLQNESLLNNTRRCVVWHPVSWNQRVPERLRFRHQPQHDIIPFPSKIKLRVNPAA